MTNTGGRSSVSGRRLARGAGRARSAITLRHDLRRSALLRFLREANVWPVLGRIAGFEWGTDDTRGNELVELAAGSLPRGTRRNEFCDDTAMGRDGNALAGFDSPYVTAQIVLELADARGGPVHRGLRLANAFALTLAVAIVYLYCMLVDQALAALAACERDLRAIMGRAVEAADYGAVLQLTGWAQAVATLAGSTSPTTLPGSSVVMTPTTRRAPTAGPRSRGGQRRYPRFTRRGDELVKTGWSKKGRDEYQHRAPRSLLLALVGRLVEAGSTRKVLPTTAFMSGNGQEGPSSYQFYLCLAWLRELGLVEQHGRQGYTVPQPARLRQVVDDAWAALSEE